ncbi:iron uptake porin [Crocosphaera sp.]|uniref:iron uptake porin n=1 Tax=Crocosphaera sp. TaxID=2729996 RepID=UPI003F266949
MWKLFSQCLKMTSGVAALSVIAAQSAIAAPDDSPMNPTQADVVSPQEALGILQNRPTLKTPLNRDTSKQFQDSGSGDGMAQVTSISELRDVSPTDWAYEALRSLVERYGCIVGYPDRTFRGNRATSRWEFAAGLNACLNTIERLLQENVAVLREDIEKLKRLAQEFEQELMALDARVDNLEARVSFLEDHQFSTTTKLNGEVLFTFSTAAGERAIDSRQRDRFFNFGEDGREAMRRIDDNATLAFRTRLNFDTSFYGKDRLRVRFQSGSIPRWDDATGTDMARLGHDASTEADVRFDDVYYRFPIGKFRGWIGTNALDIDNIFDVGNPFMASSGSGALSRFMRRNPLVFRGPEGIGAGAEYKFWDDIFAVRGLYLADNGNSPDLGEGLFNGSYSAGGQLGVYPTDSLSFSFTYLLSYYEKDDGLSASNGSRVADNPFLEAPALRDSYGITGDWRINDTFHLYATGGYALARAQGDDEDGLDRRGFGADLWTWSAILSMVDLFKEGAVLSVGGGQYVTAERIDALPGDFRVPDQDTPYIIEAQYKYPLTDGILLTPGFYTVINPEGDEDNNTIWVGVLRATYKF